MGLFIVALLIGLVLGASMAWLFLRSGQTRLQREAETVRAELELKQSQLVEQSSEIGRLKGQLEAAPGSPAFTDLLNQTLERMKETLTLSSQQVIIERAGQVQEQISEKLEPVLARLQTEIQKSLEESTKHSTERVTSLVTPKMDELKGISEQLAGLLANQNKQSGEINERLSSFISESKELRSQVDSLTKAMSTKPQSRGRWGEILLENLLQTAGLTKPRDYETQVSLQSPEGTRKDLKADVIINLPEGKHLIIDSKVQLVDYQRFVDDPNDVSAARDHTAALRVQVDELSSRRYDLALKGSLQGVFLFVPLEGALSLALEQDRNLVDYAFEKGVYLTTPLTLLPILNIVAILWLTAERDENNEKIVKLATRLYDKLALFSESFFKIKQSLDNAAQSWGKAQDQLRNGRGNAMQIAEQLKKLSGGTTKSIHDELKPLTDGIEAEEGD
jgi:DNA recombination protein RmuC